MMYFYYGEEKYVVTGRVEEKKLQDIVIEYKNTIVNNCDNKIKIKRKHGSLIPCFFFHKYVKIRFINFKKIPLKTPLKKFV